jgi:anti-sigma B factor antagonist
VTVADDTGATAAVTLDDDGSPVFSLAGELDLASVESVRAVLLPSLDPPPPRVTIDLAQLSFTDSSGIALLVEIANRVDQVDIVHVAPIVRRVLEATGLLEHFGLAP